MNLEEIEIEIWSFMEAHGRNPTTIMERVYWKKSGLTLRLQDA